MAARKKIFLRWSLEEVLFLHTPINSCYQFSLFWQSSLSHWGFSPVSVLSFSDTKTSLWLFFVWPHKLRFVHCFQVTGLFPPSQSLKTQKMLKPLLLILSPEAWLFLPCQFCLSYVKVVLNLTRKLQPTIKLT